MLPAESSYVEEQRERVRERVRERRRDGEGGKRGKGEGHGSRSSSKKKVERRMVGGGKARLESRAWLEARISVNNSRPTACIFLPDSFSLFPRSRKCDKIIRGRFNFFPPPPLPPPLSPRLTKKRFTILVLIKIRGPRFFSLRLFNNNFS